MMIKKLIDEAKAIFSRKHPLRRILLSVYFSITSVVFGAAIFMNYSPVPSLFPFDDPSAVYSVNRLDDNYYISYKSSVGGFSGVIIGNSSVNLEPLLHMKLKIDGEFAFSDKQCILNYCKNIKRGLVVNIKGVEVIASK